MPIPFCQLLEEAVDRNDEEAVRALCTAYQSIAAIALEKVDFANLLAMFLPVYFYNALLDKSKDKPKILAKLNNNLQFVIAKDQKIASDQTLDSLFLRCKREQQWDQLEILWSARCVINVFLNEWHVDEGFCPNQEVNYYFPYVLSKKQLTEKILELIKDWYEDKYSDDYCKAMIAKVVDSQMLDLKNLVPKLVATMKQKALDSKIDQARHLDKQRKFSKIILIFENQNCKRLFAVIEKEFTQDQGLHAKTAAQAFQALKTRFDSVRLLPNKTKYYEVTKQLYEDLQRSSKLDEGYASELAAIAKDVIPLLTGKLNPLDNKDANALVDIKVGATVNAQTVVAAVSKATFKPPLTGLSPTLPPITASTVVQQRLEELAFASVLRVNVQSAAASGASSPNATPVLKPADTFVTYVPGGPSLG